MKALRWIAPVLLLVAVTAFAPTVGAQAETGWTSTKTVATKGGAAEKLIPVGADEFGWGTEAVASAPQPKASTKAGDAQWTYGLAGLDGNFIPLTGYFNRDNRQDTLWYTPSITTGASLVWFWSPVGFRYSAYRFNAPGRNFKPIVGDFRGDKYSDIFWYCPGACEDYLSVADGSPGGFQNFRIPIPENYSVNTVAPGTSRVVSTPGGYLLNDYAGKDDLFFYDSTGNTSATVSFRQNEAIYDVATIADMPHNMVPVVGNFEGSPAYDDVLLYSPTGADSLLALDNRDTGDVYTGNLAVAPTSTPATIRRSAPHFWQGAGPRPADSVLFYDQATCGKASSIARWSGTAFTKVGVPKPAVVAGDDSQCRHDDAVKTLEGTPTVVIHRTHGGRRVKALDQQVVDKPGSPVVNRRLTPTTAQDLDNPFRIVTGDFNGDRKMDIIWYASGRSLDLMWYGRK